MVMNTFIYLLLVAMKHHRAAHQHACVHAHKESAHRAKPSGLHKTACGGFRFRLELGFVFDNIKGTENGCHIAHIRNLI